MSRLVYACRFEVPSERGLEEIASAYSSWITNHYQHKHAALNFSFDLLHMTEPEGLPDKHSLSSISYKIDTARAYKVHWSHPHVDDTGLEWLNDIRLGQFDDRCSVEHLISVRSVEYNITHTRLLLGSPRVVRDICAKTPAYVGGMKIEASTYDLQQSNFEVFLRLLKSDLRKLPIVFLSPYAHGDANLIDAKQLAKNLAGVAVVVHVSDPEVTWDFTDEVGRSLSCFNGAARIYWPGFSMNSDPRQHQLFLGERIEKINPFRVSYDIQRTIFAVAAFRFAPDQRISDLVRKVESEERKKTFKKIRAEGIDEFLDEYNRDLNKFEEAERHIAELKAENVTLRANQKAFAIYGNIPPEEFDETSEEENLKFSSVHEAVQAAEKRCANIDILESAHKASQESPFLRPSEIFQVLTHLDEFIDTWRANRKQGKSGGDPIQHLSEQGWGRSSMHISDTARGKYRSYYEFEYKGEKQLFEPHVTIGAKNPNLCASIHFIFDQEREMIIIAHIGKHLPNTRG